MSTVRYELRNTVGVIRLDRPESRNALDTATKDALRAAVERAASDQDARAVLLRAEGQGFCSGQDLKEHAELLESAAAGSASAETIWSTVPEHYIPIARGLATMPKPVVAAVNGIAAGAGAALAFAADFRVLAEDAGFAVAFSAIGLPCDTGTSWTLPRLVGWARATDLLMRPRTVHAEEALRIGLATSVVPAADLTEQATALATELAAGPTIAYAGIKRALAYSATHDLEDSLAFEGELMREAGGTADHQDAVRAFAAKQRPTFTGR